MRGGRVEDSKKLWQTVVQQWLMCDVAELSCRFIALWPRSVSASRSVAAAWQIEAAGELGTQIFIKFLGKPPNKKMVNFVTLRDCSPQHFH